MRQLLLIFLMTAMATSAMAQKKSIYDLSRSNDLGYSITINSNVDIKLGSPNNEETARGYRVRIFFDNKQDSRSQAEKIMEEFSELYPSIEAYQEYAAPYFRVTVGDFITRGEAIAVWGKLKRDFPTAFIVSQDISLEKAMTEELYRAPRSFILEPEQAELDDTLVD